MELSIEMLKKRIEFLEVTLLKVITELDQETDHRQNYNLIWHEFYNEIETYEE